MTDISITEAYTEACKIIGDQQVRIRLLEQALAKAQDELHEAGDRIVALTTPTDADSAKKTNHKKS